MLKKRPLNLKLINLTFLFSIGFCCISLVFAIFYFIKQFREYREITNLYSIVTRTSMELQEGSDYLTEEARFFVLTGDYKHLQNYFNERDITKRRENSLTSFIEFYQDPDTVNLLFSALNQSKKLEETEIYSMKLMIEAKHFDKNPDYIIPEIIKNTEIKPEDAVLSDDYKIAKAWLLLFSEDYMVQKHNISDYKTQAIYKIFNLTENQNEESYKLLRSIFYHMMINILLILILTIILFTCIIVYVLIPLNNGIKNISQRQRLETTRVKELNILTNTYNEMFDKNEANEILLRHKAEHDELTGLINRSAYQQILAALTKQNTTISLILIDVDIFKAINDNYGHPIGDKILKKVANTLLQNFRSRDYIARIGGDEFAVIMTDCDADYSITKHLITSKLEAALNTLSDTSDGLPSVTLSCGVEISNKGYSDEVYEHSDAALYEVKRTGRNGFKFYNPSFAENISNRNEV